MTHSTLSSTEINFLLQFIIAQKFPLVSGFGNSSTKLNKFERNQALSMELRKLLSLSLLGFSKISSGVPSSTITP